MKNEKLYSDIKSLIQQAKNFVVQNINTTLVFTNFQIGRLIVEDEQQGSERAKYAEETLIKLSKRLTKEFSRGYSVDNLQRIRTFFITYQDRIYATASRKSLRNSETELRKSASIQINSDREVIRSNSLITKFQNNFQLSWSHYILLLKIQNEGERNFYEIEAANNNWSVRELQRQYSSSLYERIALSKDKKKVKELSSKGQIIVQPIDILKEPYVLEFLGLKEESVYTETELETALINKLENFLLELGKGFLFHSRQLRISLNRENFYIDLVFYNRILKCFVLIDLKIGELKHQDIGQMQMYVNFYDREIKDKDENKTVGIVLCKQTNKAVVEYTLPENNNQIFAREYKLYLPSKKQLQNLLLEKI
jgi:predicted nuclease of restriction endonuclease-like (RecB) superfamily